MNKNQNFYITTTTPYVNAKPHIGFALEIVTADVIARHQKLLGKNVTFNTGTDEHGQKVYQTALDNGLKPQDYTDSLAPKFQNLKPLLNLSFDRFIRTTHHDHKKAAQRFWQLCDSNGDIYKKLYKIKYCVGCELEKTDSDLENNRCPLHPNADLEIREEENYFFRFSNYQQPLLDLYSKNPNFVRPSGKFNEIKSFVEQGLQDFSISRLKEKMPWGVEVPGDSDHVMYVWFDALVNYISTLGWPEDQKTFNKFWPGVQIAGKDNLRQQSAMWQAMLISAGLKPSKQILINGFISIDGQKMSKSLGNVISPQQLVTRYGVDGARFLLIHLGPITDDMDVTWKKLDERYTAHLANGLGNLISRVAALARKNKTKINSEHNPQISNSLKTAGYYTHLDKFELNLAILEVLKEMSYLDKQIEHDKPWTLKSAQANESILRYVVGLKNIAIALQPFLPDTSEKILATFQGPEAKKVKPIFPRLDS